MSRMAELAHERELEQELRTPGFDDDAAYQQWHHEYARWLDSLDQGHDMPNINAMTASTYLKQHDVTPPKIVTISRLETANLARDDQPKKIRWIMFFEELERGLVLNKTNLKRCAKACGSEESDDWLGKKIKLFFDEEVEFGGEQVGGIRITSANKPRHVDELDESDPPF